MRISRKHKKNLRYAILCILGNKEEVKSRYNKKQWLIIANDFKKACSIISFKDRKNANKLK